MVLRSLENDMHRGLLTEQQRTLAVELKEALDGSSDGCSVSSPEDILWGPFHKLCAGLFCCSEFWMPKCAVYRFLASACLRPSEDGGGFALASTVTPICTRLEFSIRLVVYHEILQRLKEEHHHQQQQQENVPAAATTAAADNDHYRRCKAHTEACEELLVFVRADEHTPFASIHNILQLAGDTA
jgi:hypothetical protein